MTDNHNMHVTQSEHGTMKSYVIGFILSILLTIIPYAITVNHWFNFTITVVSVVVLSIIQLLVQLIFFLHLSTSPTQRTNVLTFIFTVIIVIILVCGSLWIMWNMHYNMMENLN